MQRHLILLDLLTQHLPVLPGVAHSIIGLIA